MTNTNTNEILIPTPLNNSFSSQLYALYEVLSKINPGAKNHFNFSNTKAQAPLILLPICVYINDTNSSFSLPQKSKFYSSINFPTDNLKKAGNFNSSTSPILRLTKRPDIKTRDEITYDYVNNLNKKMKGIGKNALFYPVSELLNNIFEHSRKNEGWIFAQIDKTNKRIDICIVDSGRGFRKSYLEEENLDISHLEAIGEAMRGHSTKKDNERGYGLWTSKKLICKGLKGNLLIITGNAVFLAEGKEENVIEMDKNIWNGVILSYRIPVPKETVDIIQYIE